MGRVLVFSMLAALNPTLLAATTLMLLLENPKRLMLGYLLGATMTSVTLGLLIVFAVENSSAVSSTKSTISPVADLVLGTLALIGAAALGRDPETRRERERRLLRRRRKPDAGPKPPPKWQQKLSQGTPRTTFVIGALLTLPGASYLAALSTLDKLNYAVPQTVLGIILINVVMLMLLEVPLLCFTFAPEWTPGAIERTKAWIGARWRHLAVRALTVIGLLLIIKGVIGLLSG